MRIAIERVDTFCQSQSNPLEVSKPFSLFHSLMRRTHDIEWPFNPPPTTGVIVTQCLLFNFGAVFVDTQILDLIYNIL